MNGRAIFSAAMASLSLLLATSSQGSDGDTLYLVDVYGRREIKADAAKKLAPALLATRDGGGVLKGCDASGKPVIAVPAAKLEKIHQSKAVRAISAEVPKDWQPVHKLKLSYKRDDPPSLAELKHLGLKLVEDYQKGGFMIVEPTDGQIDSVLASRLEHFPKFTYVTPLFQMRVIQPPVCSEQ